MRRLTLTHKFVWLYLLGGLLPLLLAIGVHVQSSLNTERATATARLDDLSSQGAARIDEFVLGTLREFKGFATDQRLPLASPAELSAVLAGHTYAHPIFKELLWIGAEGTVRAASNPRRIGQSLSQISLELGPDLATALDSPAGQLGFSDLNNVAPAVRAAVEGGKLGSVALTFEFLVRVDRPDSSMAGVLIAVLGPEMVQVVLEDLTRRIPGKLPLSLLNRDGIVMVTNDPAQKLLTKHTALTRAGRHNATMGSGNFTSRAADGTALLGTLGRLQGLKVGNQRETDWVVLGLMPESIITAQVWQGVWTTFAPLLGASALMFLVTLGIIRRIVRPLRQLGTAAGQRGQMRQTMRAQSVGDDEVGLLGLAFNHMIDDLQKAQQTQQAEHAKREQVELELRQSKAAIEQAQLNLKKSHDELVQRSWLSELLQSCVDVKEASAVIVRVAPNLFPDASGTLYLQTGAQPLLEQVAYWGAAAAAQNFGRDDCWALRRSVSHLAGQGGLCCPHTGPTPNATSLCLPLLARGESIGVLHLSGANLAPRRELAEGVAALIAMSLAHLQLSDTLRQQMRKLELAERKAIEERRFLNQIIDKVADPIFVKDQQLRLILVNEAYCALTKMRREALIGSRAEDVFTPEQAAVIRVQDESALESGQFEVHENLVTINGTNHTIQSKKSRLPMADGTHYLVCVTHDITEHKNAEQARAEAEALHQVNTVKSEFLSSLSHELRTPLNISLGCAEVLDSGLDGVLTAQQQEHVHAIHESNQRLLTLVNAAHDLAQLMAGQMTWQSMPTDIAALIDELVAQYQPLAREKAITLDGTSDARLGLIKIDGEKVRQMVRQLLANVIRLTSAGGRVSVAALSLATEATETANPLLEIRVTNSGCGIAPVELACLFQPLARLDAGLDRQAGGTELGLVLVKRLAELGGGSVALDSTPDGGCVFSVRLPA